ncbi:hypothetical protein [Paraburkholderia domus]|uniref:hypothetical protein n=1 Tax=Paraburkholderia domus TaxID=2793075 RepID=UPI00191189C4|nr:hypothetical protein [Paraburkholderia domus]MBK5058927.1 hypothetical protein [Burkholderia sp. R-70199]CAE6880471.1 hypothetical protein R70199_02498 [Paraburkholderia domus]
MSRMPIDSGRYVLVATNGTRQWARDQVALQAEIIELLDQHTGLTKKRIITTLSTAQAAVETALASLLLAGTIERYRAMSARRRLDEHWCIAGQTPAASRANFRAMEILAGFQQAAARQAGSISV